MSSEIHYIRGTLHWAKVLGAPRKNEYTGEREWSVDITPDAEGRTLLRKLGLADRLREPKEGDSRTESFVSFRQREFRADGAPNDPIKVVDVNNQPWPEDTLLGNGTTGEVKFVVRDYGKGKKKGMYIRALRVGTLVPYASTDFAPVSDDDAFFANATPAPAAKAAPAKVDLLAELDNPPFDTDDLDVSSHDALDDDMPV